jgi:hypothetical protein
VNGGNTGDLPMNHRIIRRVYVDASAVSGAFNERFGQETKPFWDAVLRGEIVIIVSDLLELEMLPAPQCVRDFFRTIPKSQIERVESTEESDDLADRYIAEKVVGQSSLDDCKHIAIATLAHADALVSWNFKHIVNANKILGYNGVNMKLGYSQINIRTPYEVANDET